VGGEEDPSQSIRRASKIRLRPEPDIKTSKRIAAQYYTPTLRYAEWGGGSTASYLIRMPEELSGIEKKSWNPGKKLGASGEDRGKGFCASGIILHKKRPYAVVRLGTRERKHEGGH